MDVLAVLRPFLDAIPALARSSLPDVPDNVSESRPARRAAPA